MCIFEQRCRSRSRSPPRSCRRKDGTRQRLRSALRLPRMSPEQRWVEMRAAFVSLQDEMRRSQEPPSDWCRCLLRWGCSDPVHRLRLSSEERLHITLPVTREKLACFDPSARETLYRVHEMHAALAGNARWDPTGLLALPNDVIEGLTEAFERRGCRKFGIEDALCLPFLLYSTDTVHILRLSNAMRGLRSFRGSASSESAKAVLGDYAGVICALVEAGGLLRRYVTPSRLLPVLSLQTQSFFDTQHLAFRGLWLRDDFEIAELCRCYNLTSWSLWVRGALSVLRVYEGRVDREANVPVLLIALRSNIMKLALPTTALYFAASPDGGEAGKAGRPYECLPDSRHRPKRSDAGVAQCEKEIVLPPFCQLTPFKCMGAVSLRRLRSATLLRPLLLEWQLSPCDADWLHRELNNAVDQALSGTKALTRRGADRCMCLFVRDVHGSWFE